MAFLINSGVSTTLFSFLKSSKTSPQPFTTQSRGFSAMCVKIPVSSLNKSTITNLELNAVAANQGSEAPEACSILDPDCEACQ